MPNGKENGDRKVVPALAYQALQCDVQSTTSELIKEMKSSYQVSSWLD